MFLVILSRTGIILSRFGRTTESFPQGRIKYEVGLCCGGNADMNRFVIQIMHHSALIHQECFRAVHAPTVSFFGFDKDGATLMEGVAEYMQISRQEIPIVDELVCIGPNRAAYGVKASLNPAWERERTVLLSWLRGQSRRGRCNPDHDCQAGERHYPCAPS